MHQQIHGASDRTLSDGNNLAAAYMYLCLKHCTKNRSKIQTSLSSVEVV